MLSCLMQINTSRAMRARGGTERYRYMTQVRPCAHTLSSRSSEALPLHDTVSAAIHQGQILRVAQCMCSHGLCHSSWTARPTLASHARPMRRWR